MKITRQSVRELIWNVLECQRFDCREINIYFVTERRICDLHRQFFDDPTPTDCISFPIDPETLGEIFVCPRTALKYADLHHINPFDELALYIIHGVLHLLGFDDLTPSDRRTMRKNEEKCMAYCKHTRSSLRPA